MSENKVQVLIVLGSPSDEKFLGLCVEFLKRMNIRYAVRVASAHRSPQRLLEVLQEFEKSCQVIIAFAGHAAHLAGVIAAKVSQPVIAVPLPTSDLVGLDSLLSCVQMPGGVPVAVMAIGESGSHNAACFATQILSLGNAEIKDRWQSYKKELATKVSESSKEIEKKWQP